MQIGMVGFQQFNQCWLALGGERQKMNWRQKLCFCLRFQTVAFRRFLHDDMAIGSTEAKRVDPGTKQCLPIRSFPVSQLGDDFDRSVLRIEKRVCRLIVQRSRNFLCRRASTTLMSEARPDAATVWPIFVLTEPTPHT